MSDYNYEGFSPDNYDLQGISGPAIGQKALDFKLETTTGELKKLLDFDGELLILELGSVTCPLFHTRRKGMLRLDLDFPDLSFAILYVREAHPGARIPAHKTFEEKKACATRLTVEDGDNRTIFIDGLDGAAHEAYGALPNAIYIINKAGIVLFKAEWNNLLATRKAIETIKKGKEVHIKSYFRPAKPWIVHSTVKRAGNGSGGDFFRGLPKLIWNMAIKRNVKTFFK